MTNAVAEPEGVEVRKYECPTVIVGERVWFYDRGNVHNKPLAADVVLVDGNVISLHVHFPGLGVREREVVRHVSDPHLEHATVRQITGSWDFMPTSGRSEGDAPKKVSGGDRPLKVIDDLKAQVAASDKQIDKLAEIIESQSAAIVKLESELRAEMSRVEGVILLASDSPTDKK